MQQLKPEAGAIQKTTSEKVDAFAGNTKTAAFLSVILPFIQLFEFALNPFSHPLPMQTVLEFLRQLDQNNTREWFEAHKDFYEQAKAEQVDFLKQLLQEFAAFEPSFSHLQPKDTMFRLFRDVRFSKDKTPYKNHFGMYFEQEGKKSIRAGYYLHIQPGNQGFMGGGMYMPEADALKKIRQEIDFNSQKFNAILQQPEFLHFYKSLSEEQKLKKAPKDYPADHHDIELLKLKGFFSSHPVTDEQVQKKDFASYAGKVFQALKPLNDFLNEAIAG